MKRVVCFLLASGVFLSAGSQELYPYSEPASNMPAKSLVLKSTSMFMRGVHSSAIRQRHIPEVQVGLNKNWMVHAGLNLSDMHGHKFIGEGARLYTKYRFLSKDQMHKHFRMAAFGAVAYSRNHLDHNELNLMGDHTGVQYGLIATQLWNKLAISGTASGVEVLNRKRWDKVPSSPYAFQAIQYSLSAGYLVLPVTYKDYDQTNLNVYVELLGSRNLNFPKEKYYIDLAPSVQAIFNSTSKLNLGYRFQLAGDIYRLGTSSLMVSYEHLFLNALKNKKKKLTEVE